MKSKYLDKKILIKNLRNSLFHRSSGASTCFDFKSALTCYRALLEILAPQIFLMCYFTGLTVEITVNYRLFGYICTKIRKGAVFLFLKNRRLKNALSIYFCLTSKLHRFGIMASPAFFAVKANANKNWQSQHLITFEVFVSETLCKRIALVSLAKTIKR